MRAPAWLPTGRMCCRWLSVCLAWWRPWPFSSVTPQPHRMAPSRALPRGSARSVHFKYCPVVCHQPKDEFVPVLAGGAVCHVVYS